MGASVNSRDLKGMTPLYNAICDGNSTLTAEILLKEKCDLNIVDNTGQWNELHQVSLIDRDSFMLIYSLFNLMKFVCRQRTSKSIEKNFQINSLLDATFSSKFEHYSFPTRHTHKHFHPGL